MPTIIQEQLRRGRTKRTKEREHAQSQSQSSPSSVCVRVFIPSDIFVNDDQFSAGSFVHGWSWKNESSLSSSSSSSSREDIYDGNNNKVIVWNVVISETKEDNTNNDNDNNNITSSVDEILNYDSLPTLVGNNKPTLIGKVVKSNTNKQKSKSNSSNDNDNNNNEKNFKSEFFIEFDFTSSSSTSSSSSSSSPAVNVYSKMTSERIPRADVLFVSISRDAIDMTENKIKKRMRKRREVGGVAVAVDDDNDTNKRTTIEGVNAVLHVLALSSLAAKKTNYHSSSSSSRRRRKTTSTPSFRNILSKTIVKPSLDLLQRLMDDFKVVPSFFGSANGGSSWKGGRFRCKSVSEVSTCARIISARIATLQKIISMSLMISKEQRQTNNNNNNNIIGEEDEEKEKKTYDESDIQEERERERNQSMRKLVVLFVFDIFLARTFKVFVKIASRLQILSAGFMNGEYLILNANWLARGNPLGIKLHLPLARSLSALAIVLADGYSSILSYIRFDTIITFVDEKMWFLGLSTQLACLSDFMFMFTTHAAALHVYSSLLVTAQIAFGKFCYEFGFGNPKNEINARQSTKNLVFGVLFVPPIFLFLPTTFAYFVSYLVLHSSALLLRAALVFLVCTIEFMFSFEDDNDDDDDDYDDDDEKMIKLKLVSSDSLILTIKVESTYKEKKLGKYNKNAFKFLLEIAKAFTNAIKSFGRLPVSLDKASDSFL